MKKSEWDDLRTKGWAKLVEWFGRFVTLPFRRPVATGVFVVCCVIALYLKMQLAPVLKEYKETLQVKPVVQIVENSPSFWEKTKEKVSHFFRNLLPVKDNKKEVLAQKKKGDRFVAWHVAKFHHATYEPKEPVLKLKPRFSFVAAKRDAKPVVKEEPVVSIENLPANTNKEYSENKLEELYYERPDLKLKYLTRAHSLDGEVRVVGPNSLVINKTFVFLYGIYTNPDTYDVIAARKYLEDLLQTRRVRCDVVAYTSSSNVATALCFVDGVFVNQAMVDNNLAKNVALR